MERKQLEQSIFDMGFMNTICEPEKETKKNNVFTI